MWRPVGAELLATARQLRVGLVAWSPLGGSFLTGTVTSIDAADFRSKAPACQPAPCSATTTANAPVRALAGLDLTPGQLALAWPLAQDPHVVPIPGSRTPDHIRENLDAARVSLHPDPLRRLDQALAAAQPEGGTLL